MVTFRHISIRLEMSICKSSSKFNKICYKNVNNGDMDIMIKRPKKGRKLPEVLSQDEVLKIYRSN